MASLLFGQKLVSFDANSGDRPIKSGIRISKIFLFWGYAPSVLPDCSVQTRPQWSGQQFCDLTLPSKAHRGQGVARRTTVERDRVVAGRVLVVD